MSATASMLVVDGRMTWRFSMTQELVETSAPPPTSLSMVPLAALEDEALVGEDDCQFRGLRLVPFPANPLRVTFWRILALKHLSKIIVQLLDPRSMASLLDEQLQQDGSGRVRRFADGRHEIVLHDKQVEFRDFRHGLHLHISVPNEARRRAGRESGAA